MQRGFTLIEIIIVMAILAVVFAMSAYITTGFYQSYSFNSERATLVSVLEKARSQSMANINAHEHGVFITSSAFILFEGTAPLTYTTRISSLDLPITTTPRISHSGLSTIIFKQLSGDVDSSMTGMITLQDETHIASISLNTAGGIGW